MMTEPIARKLNFNQKRLLLAAGWMAVAVPIVIGVLNAPASQAQSPSQTSTQDISGDWQGAIEGPQMHNVPGGRLRIVMKIAKAGGGGWSARLYNIDLGAQPLGASAPAMAGSVVRFSMPAIGSSFEGKMSEDGASIVGSWTPGQGAAMPLTFVRATKETAWEIPAPLTPSKPMPADANPSFEVATIKPSHPDQSNVPMNKSVVVQGRNFSTGNTSLSDLIGYAYGVQVKQVMGGPEWLDKDKYDIAAVPDAEGQPNAAQWKTMLQKLLADRFGLKFHHDKRELLAYVLSVGKNGPKLTKSESANPLPRLGLQPGPGGITSISGNATMVDFTGFLQIIVLDRPVVDQTGITGRYDFQFTFMPDDSEFGGHPPPLPASENPAPGLFEAIQQIGLKLDAEKAPVDVIVIDHVERPSAN